MQWIDGHVRVAHPREDWGHGTHEDLIIHARWDALKGTGADDDANLKKEVLEKYQAAKFQYDQDAGFELVESLVAEDKINELADIVFYSDKSPLFVFPYPAFDDDDAIDAETTVKSRPTNALPFVYAAYLEQVLGGEVETNIFQRARVGRTKLTSFMRFLCQPEFGGEVRHDKAYILVDDVVTTGGTLAALRSYIIRSGGSVLCGTSLAHKYGINQKFGVAEGTVAMLQSLYGNGINEFWSQEIGHELSKITEAEGQLLVRWALEHEGNHGTRRGDQMFQRLRDRLDQAASTGR